MKMKRFVSGPAARRRRETWACGWMMVVVLAIPAGWGAEPLLLSGDWTVRPPQTPRYIHSELLSPGVHFRLASYNLENFTDGLGMEETNRTPEQAEVHARAAASYLAEINADVVVLQEVENPTMAEKLNGSFSAPYPIVALTKFGRGRPLLDKLNLAVLSRLPIRRLREISFDGLQGMERPPRGLLNFELELEPGRKLLVYVVHLKSNYGDPVTNIAKRRHALRIAREDADRIMARDPAIRWEVVVAGDMNVDPDDPLFAKDISLQPFMDWADVWRGWPKESRITLPTRHGDPLLEFPAATFDRFIVSPELTNEPWKALTPGVLPKGVNTADVTVLPGTTSEHVSDHYPVYLDFQR